ncbi:uncharacterized protein LOC116246414 [Nymphaea colorata]|nr:uncharacterized protein LOC116246414 [Nymphaea colorata]
MACQSENVPYLLKKYIYSHDHDEKSCDASVEKWFQQLQNNVTDSNTSIKNLESIVTSCFNDLTSRMERLESESEKRKKEVVSEFNTVMGLGSRVNHWNVKWDNPEGLSKEVDVSCKDVYHLMESVMKNLFSFIDESRRMLSKAIADKGDEMRKPQEKDNNENYKDYASLLEQRLSGVETNGPIEYLDMLEAKDSDEESEYYCSETESEIQSEDEQIFMARPTNPKFPAREQKTLRVDNYSDTVPYNRPGNDVTVPPHCHRDRYMVWPGTGADIAIGTEEKIIHDMAYRAFHLFGNLDDWEEYKKILSERRLNAKLNLYSRALYAIHQRKYWDEAYTNLPPRHLGIEMDLKTIYQSVQGLREKVADKENITSIMQEIEKLTSGGNPLQDVKDITKHLQYQIDEVNRQVAEYDGVTNPGFQVESIGKTIGELKLAIKEVDFQTMAKRVRTIQRRQYQDYARNPYFRAKIDDQNPTNKKADLLPNDAFIDGDTITGIVTAFDYVGLLEVHENTFSHKTGIGRDAYDIGYIENKIETKEQLEHSSIVYRPKIVAVKLEFAVSKKSKEIFQEIDCFIDTGATISVAKSCIFPECMWKSLNPKLAVCTVSGHTIFLDQEIFVRAKVDGEDLTLHFYAYDKQGYDILIGQDILDKHLERYSHDKANVYWTINGVEHKIPRTHVLKFHTVKSFAGDNEEAAHAYAKNNKLQEQNFRGNFKPDAGHEIYLHECKPNGNPFYLQKACEMIFELAPSHQHDKELDFEDINEFSAKEIFEKYLCSQSAYSLSKKDAFEIEVKLKPNHSQVMKSKCIPMDEEDEEKCKHDIEEWAKAGVVRKSKTHGGLVSSAFYINSHQKGKQLVIDYKHLNKNVIRDWYPLPRKDSLFTLIGNCQWFSKFEVQSGFSQLKLAEDCKKYFAFSTLIGTYEWNVMPIGYCNAPSVLQKHVDSIFGPYHDFVRCFLDEIFVFSKTKDEHICHLKQFAKACCENGIVLSAPQMEILKNEIDFLGFHIKGSQILLLPHILRKIQEFPDQLKDKRQLHMLLGCLSYAEAFLKDFARRRKPIAKLLKKGEAFIWDREKESWLKELKAECDSLPPLQLPSGDDFLIVEANSSDAHWNGKLKFVSRKDLQEWQVANSSNKERYEVFSIYASGAFSKAEKKYPACQKDVLAAKRVMRKFSSYLLPRRFLLRTSFQDINSVLYNRSSDTVLEERLLKWQEWFQSFTFHNEEVGGEATEENSALKGVPKEVNLSRETSFDNQAIDQSTQPCKFSTSHAALELSSGSVLDNPEE